MFIRSKNNPIIKPNRQRDWEARKTYNPGVIWHKGKYYLFYRAVGTTWQSAIGLATSVNGERFNKLAKPIISPGAGLESRGVEDPRVVRVDKKFFMTYTAYDGQAARLNLAVSSDLKKWKKIGRTLPQWNAKKAKAFRTKWDPAQNTKAAKTDWHKAGGIFPEKINGKYWMIFGDSHLWLANSADGLKWQPVWQSFISPRSGHYFDSVHVEMGPPPIKTDKGWLVLYHGINNKIEYKLGYLLLALDNPTKILYRSQQPIFTPQMPYEISGLVDILPGGFKAMECLSPKALQTFIAHNKKIGRMPKVIFCNGAVVRNNKLEIFYGASDSVICKATADLKKVLSAK
ncbi:MAG: hypothetical protein V1765_01090 [bacterium]